MTEISQEVEALGKKLDEIHRRSSLSGFQAAHRQKPGQVEKAIQVALPAIQAQVLAGVKERLLDGLAKLDNEINEYDGLPVGAVEEMIEKTLATLNPSEQGDSDEPADK